MVSGSILWYGVIVTDENVTDFRPSAITVEENALNVVRAVGTEIDVDNPRLYGMAMEFASQNREEFTEFVRENDNSDT